MPEQDIPESDDPLNQGAEVVMPPNSGGDDAPSKSTMAPVSGSSPGEDAAVEMDRGPSACLPLAQSPERTIISLMRMRRWKWRQAWPTSQSRPSVDKSGRVRVPPLLRHLPLWKAKMFNCRSCRALPHGLQRRSCTDDMLEEASDVQKMGSQPPAKTLE